MSRLRHSPAASRTNSPPWADRQRQDGARTLQPATRGGNHRRHRSRPAPTRRHRGKDGRNRPFRSTGGGLSTCASWKTKRSAHQHHNRPGSVNDATADEDHRAVPRVREYPNRCHPVGTPGRAPGQLLRDQFKCIPLFVLSSSPEKMPFHPKSVPICR